MGILVVRSLWKEIRKDAFFLGVGFALGSYMTYKHLENLNKYSHKIEYEQNVNSQQIYSTTNSLEAKVRK
jgi:hypothetical protein